MSNRRSRAIGAARCTPFFSRWICTDSVSLPAIPDSTQQIRSWGKKTHPPLFVIPWFCYADGGWLGDKMGVGNGTDASFRFSLLLHLQTTSCVVPGWYQDQDLDTWLHVAFDSGHGCDGDSLPPHSQALGPLLANILTIGHPLLSTCHLTGHGVAHIWQMATGGSLHPCSFLVPSTRRLSNSSVLFVPLCMFHPHCYPPPPMPCPFPLLHPISSCIPATRHPSWGRDMAGVVPRDVCRSKLSANLRRQKAAPGLCKFAVRGCVDVYPSFPPFLPTACQLSRRHGLGLRQSVRPVAGHVVSSFVIVHAMCVCLCVESFPLSI